ncbi:hypothetical protein SAMN04488005_2914 [Yoonia tamlensis]|uniref:Uncharacterized protein n=1 Tax=Yoonia tamlensis TaxID=390270 RepID=A0A1I6HPD0_9RHOB|nr:hypothetical protein [Yoonia tamlensis]SFR56306.1 hypothetical protein SAMN04488005_2914 [Yoonia tamlensis]
MAQDKKPDMNPDFPENGMAGLRSTGAHGFASNTTSEDRFPQVDDILDRLTTNTRAVEKK